MASKANSMTFQNSEGLGLFFRYFKGHHRFDTVGWVSGRATGQ